MYVGRAFVARLPPNLCTQRCSDGAVADAETGGVTGDGAPPSFATETAANSNNATDHTANILQPSSWSPVFRNRSGRFDATATYFGSVRTSYPEPDDAIQ